MSYLGRSAKLSLKAQEKVSFLATAGQTSKTGLSYTPTFVEVYVNGVLLTDTTDFTATNGNSITFTVALLLNDEVTVISLKTFTVADHYNKTEADVLLDAKAKLTKSTTAPSSPAQGDQWFDTTSSVVAMKVYNGTAWATMSNKFSASGGTITQSGGYTIHTFTSSGTFTPNTIGTVDYLVIAGGGGGSSGNNAGGGGGAGGLLTATGFLVAATGLTVTVGAGGAGGSSPANGSNSVFSSITATGGGKGGSTGAGTAGGSGGGGGSTNDSAIKAGGAGTSGQGNAGGTGQHIPGSFEGGGGGGGAGAVGNNSSTNYGGAGGTGVANSYSGSSDTYAGGGGAGGNTLGAGGVGGGGSGSQGSGAAGAGTANKGGGGGGGVQPNTSGAGGSGIVIIRYAD
jgi:hypothetical protein